MEHKAEIGVKWEESIKRKMELNLRIIKSKWNYREGKELSYTNFKNVPAERF